jgi:hypothetical protein
LVFAYGAPRARPRSHFRRNPIAPRRIPSHVATT